MRVLELCTQVTDLQQQLAAAQKDVDALRGRLNNTMQELNEERDRSEANLGRWVDENKRCEQARQLLERCLPLTNVESELWHLIKGFLTPPTPDA